MKYALRPLFIAGVMLSSVSVEGVSEAIEHNRLGYV